MKRLLLPFLISTLLVSGCSENDTPINPEPPDDSPEEWTLIWEEEFDQDLSEWTVWNGGAFNNELQHYQGDNLELKDGLLHIHQRREAVTGLEHPLPKILISHQAV